LPAIVCSEANAAMALHATPATVARKTALYRIAYASILFSRA
jgi:hypothetical protein